MPQVRRALHADAHELAQLAEHTFRDTFASENSAEDMDLHCRASYGETLQAEEIARADTVTLLCEAHGDLIGFTQVRWHSAPSSVIARTPGEIQRLYVDRGWHGRGIAQTLMRSALDALAAQACDVVWLGVWERNLKAIAFYKKIGFVAVGSHIFAVGRDPQRDIIMARPLAHANI
jgi:ribosomal protein S18 acetylase RimI-like enzyme